MFAVPQLLLLNSSVVLLLALAVLLHTCRGDGEQCYYASRANTEFPWATGMRIEYLKLKELMEDWGTKDIQNKGLDAHTCNPPFQGCFTFVCKIPRMNGAETEYTRVSGCTPDALNCNEQDLMPICKAMVGPTKKTVCIRCNGTLCNRDQIVLGAPPPETTTTTTTASPRVENASTTQRAGNESFHASISTDQPLREDLNSTTTSKQSSTGGAGAEDTLPSVSPAIMLLFGAPVVAYTNGAAGVASLSIPSAIAVLLIFGVVVTIRRCG